MSVFISMLRGINVSGRNKIPMAALRSMYEDLKLEQVRTYIQSGNVVFRYRSGTDLSRRLAAQIRETFGFEVPVVIRTAEELDRIIRDNPWMSEPDIEPDKLHITFLSESPDATLVGAIDPDAYAPDRFHLSGREVYLYCPGGYGNTKLNNTFFEKKLKVTATTRNWKTVNELARMAAE